ncbi:geranylgeranyl pyrophosphate synthetase [Penicillium diatomitis]|uniref:Geranylgeranyl pyrophosphate synthetase n=1 Tax=Penicillium diatomitis TaxID=2819901 RepID=A0A9W9XLM3_9EURO|nr:geranylgeranyl pyrophosphate synthetase [Penicillium diatomitis]KAJ5495148.1 geranylgeranyl pyrophosphate synthetase [Penicillium diatomitis]
MTQEKSTEASLLVVKRGESFNCHGNPGLGIGLNPFKIPSFVALATGTWPLVNGSKRLCQPLPSPHVLHIGHHRIISYELGGLTFLIRHEVDSFAGEGESQGDGIGCTSNPLALSQNDPSVGNKASPTSNLNIHGLAKSILRGSDLGIKIRTIQTSLDLDEVMPQLCISQTPNLVPAYHGGDRLECLEMENVTTQIEDWKGRHEHHIGAFVNLIKTFSDKTRQIGGTAMIRFNPATDTVDADETHGLNMLPDDLYALYAKETEVDLGEDMVSR